MKQLSLISIMLLATASIAYADKCDTWTHRAYPVTLEACSYPNGGSGYYRITNEGSSNATICWTVVSNNGRENKGCRSDMAAGEEAIGACHSCGSKNEGVQFIRLDKYVKE